jgi:hypothetical protein
MCEQKRANLSKLPSCGQQGFAEGDEPAYSQLEDPTQKLGNSGGDSQAVQSYTSWLAQLLRLVRGCSIRTSISATPALEELP